MSNFSDFLAGRQLPGWVMLHNATLSYNSENGHHIDAYEDIFWSESINDLREKIPQPQLLITREAQEMAAFRFSEEELLSQCFVFNDTPESLTSESNDKDIFGESWVIFWVVPADLDMIVNFLTSKLEKEANERIQPEQLKEVWHDYVSRIYFKHDGKNDLYELTHLYDHLQEELVNRINASSKAPDESAWEILDEEAMLGGDEDW